MALITKPDFTYVWASGGAVVAPNDAKKQLGWVAEAPPFQYDNWLQNRQDQMLAHINQRGIAAWDAMTNYEAGGLSYVQGSDGKVYKSVAASGPSATVQNPTTDGTDTYWTIAFADVGAFLTQAAGDTRYTQRSNNLSDLTDVTTARTNLGVYSKAETDTRYTQRSNNLSDLTNVATARTNLGVASAADSTAYSPGSFYGFTLANNSGAPTTTVDVGAGAARSQAGTANITLSTTLRGILQSSGAWTAGDNQNKLDTGARANNSWYHVYVILKTSDGTADILFSLSLPTMPSGYAGSRRIGAVKTDGSGNILAFTNVGNEFIWKTLPLDVSVADATDADYVISVPLGVRVLARIGLYAAGGDSVVTVRPTDSSAYVPSYAVYIGGNVGANATTLEYNSSESTVLTDTLGRVRVVAPSAATPFSIRAVTYSYAEIGR